MTMKKILLPSVVLLATTLLLAACSNGNDQGNTLEKASALHSKNDDDAEKDNQTDGEEITSKSIEPESDDSDKISVEEESENTEVQSEGEGSGVLSEYSPEEIDYARVWLQLGATQDIDELNAKHISAGEPLNPDDKTTLNKNPLTQVIMKRSRH
ncbi:lipoprotein [Bacillus freudenreichii]|nr:lipoprotein [Bacillus freudenreichii]